MVAVDGEGGLRGGGPVTCLADTVGEWIMAVDAVNVVLDAFTDATDSAEMAMRLREPVRRRALAERAMRAAHAHELTFVEYRAVRGTLVLGHGGEAVRLLSNMVDVTLQSRRVGLWTPVPAGELADLRRQRCRVVQGGGDRRCRGVHGHDGPHVWPTAVVA